MSDIRVLKEEEFGAFLDVALDAYPGWSVAPDEREKVKGQLLETHLKDPMVTFYGLFRDGGLLGGMRFHDFEMNFLQHRIRAGGVGLVAVHLAHKKEHVAREMVAYFLRHYREKGAPLTLLYPFRPDFYRKMGFGYGTKINQYRIAPASLPKGPSKAHVRYLTVDDSAALAACYNRYAHRTHGMIDKYAPEMERLLKSPQHRVVGYEREGEILGYVAFQFENGESFIVNDIHVRYFVFETYAAFLELSTFLHSQADQIRRIIFDTHDEAFHFMPFDPRNGTPELIPSVYHETNAQGVGIMYRVVDVAGMFAHLGARNFGGQTVRLRLTVEDSFLPENAGSYLLAFESGRLVQTDAGGWDVEVTLDVAEFSSLLVGAVTFKGLYRYGLAEISDPDAVETVERIFAVDEKPVCMTHF